MKSCVNSAALGSAARLFYDLVHLEEPLRSSELVRRCHDDAELFFSVRKLFQADAGGDSDRVDETIGYFCAISQRPETALSDPMEWKLEGSGLGLEPIRLLGSGNAASVVLARDRSFSSGRLVAVKVLLPGPDADAGLRSCLWREIAALRVLRHPRIPRLLDYGSTRNGSPWFASDFIEGKPILEHARDHALEAPERVRVFCGLLEALAHAHDAGIAHGDVKNTNSVVDAEHRAFLIDFGACFHRSGFPGKHSDAFPLALTPRYASPEQLNGQSPSPVSDVYSAGVLLEELMDQMESRSSSPAPSGDAHLSFSNNASVQIGADSCSFTSGVLSVIKRSKSLDPRNRFPCAASMRSALVQCF